MEEPKDGGTVVLKAVAVKSGYKNSAVAELEVKFMSDAASELADALQSDGTVQLTADTVINGTITIPVGVTLDTNGYKLIGTEDGHLEVYGTLYAGSFPQIDQFWIEGGTANFYKDSNWQVIDQDRTEFGVTAFIGKVENRETMTVDVGHVTVEYHQGNSGGNGDKIDYPIRC